MGQCVIALARQTWFSVFDSKSCKRGRRKLTPQHHPVTFTSVPWLMRLSPTHIMHIHVN